MFAPIRFEVTHVFPFCPVVDLVFVASESCSTSPEEQATDADRAGTVGLALVMECVLSICSLIKPAVSFIPVFGGRGWGEVEGGEREGEGMGRGEGGGGD